MAEALAVGRLWPADDVSRRALLRGLGVALAGGVAVAVARPRLSDVFASATTASPWASGRFEPYIGEQFALRPAAAGVAALELSKVRPLRFGAGSPLPGTSADSFSLLFRGPAAHPLAQDVYELHHPRLGSVALLLAPMRPEPEAQYYEAIFNRAVPR